MKKIKLVLLILQLAILVLMPGVQAQVTGSDDQKQALTYVIKYGDTMSELAAIFNVPISVLMEYNPRILNENEIKAGYGLRVPLGSIAANIKMPEKIVGQVMVLPLEILELPPEMTRQITSEIISAFVEAIPEQIVISQQGLDQIKAAFDDSAERIISAIPATVDLQPQVYGRISDSAREGTNEALKPLINSINEHKSWLGERLEQGGGFTISDINWLSWLIFLLLIIILIILAYVALNFRKVLNREKEINKKKQELITELSKNMKSWPGAMKVLRKTSYIWGRDSKLADNNLKNDKPTEKS